MSESETIGAEDVGSLEDLEPRPPAFGPGGPMQPVENWLAVERFGTEGIRCESDPAWNWSWRTTVARSGPSATLQQKIRDLTRELGPPPNDMTFYGEFDEPDEVTDEA